MRKIDHDPFDDDAARTREAEDWGGRERDVPPAPELNLRALSLLDEIISATPAGDARLRYLMLLRHQLETDEAQFREAQSALAEYEEAYEKLTAPANRIATFLDSPEAGIARIALGDAEYYATIDPKLDATELHIGTQVKINEAYAVIGNLGMSVHGTIVKIAEVLDDHRLRVSLDGHGLQSRMVWSSEALVADPPKQGDDVQMDPTMRVALTKIAVAEAKDYYFEDVPAISWEQVGGQEAAIQLIRDTIELPLLHPELYERFGKRPLKGILLYGPPGCGKTLIGKATAYNLTQEYRKHHPSDRVEEYFMYINGPKILNMFLGESERMVREIFAQARERAKEGFLVFIFIDEAESLLRTRSSGRVLNIANTVVPQFAAEMDGLVALRNVVVMLTSNRPDYIDPAILRPERIDRKVKVGRPDRRASRDILKIYLHEDVPLDPDALAAHDGDFTATRDTLVESLLHLLFSRTSETEFLEVYLHNGGKRVLHWRDLVSGALLMSVVERAKDFAIRRSIERQSQREGIREDDLLRAVQLEYKENEIFPKTDNQEDWLKLLDYEPENVATVRPIRARTDADARHKVI